MFNRFNSIILILLFALNAYGQCDGCPSSIEAPPSVGETPTQFNGFTSEVNLYDGDNPDCYMPVSNSLNGQLEGIDNKICELNSLIEVLNVACSDSAELAAIDSVIIALQNQFDSLKTILVTSLDNSITVTTTTNSDSVVYDLAVNYNTIQDSLLSGVNTSCLDSVETVAQVLNDLIYLACDSTSAVFTGGCVEFDPNYTATITSLAASINVQIVPLNNLTSSMNECITDINYVYEVYDSDGDIIEGGNGIVYGTTTLNVPYNFSIPTTYGFGARTLKITMTIVRETCSRGRPCPNETYFNPLLYTISAP